MKWGTSVDNNSKNAIIDIPSNKAFFFHVNFCIGCNNIHRGLPPVTLQGHTLLCPNQPWQISPLLLMRLWWVQSPDQSSFNSISLSLNLFLPLLKKTLDSPLHTQPVHIHICQCSHVCVRGSKEGDLALNDIDRWPQPLLLHVKLLCSANMFLCSVSLWNLILRQQSGFCVGAVKTYIDKMHWINEISSRTHNCVLHWCQTQRLPPFKCFVKRQSSTFKIKLLKW